MSNLLPLTTVARVQAYGDIPMQTWTSANSALLQDMINSVSLSFEQFCSRGFLSVERTQQRKLHSDFVPCAAFPVASITAVYVSRTGRSSDFQQLTIDQYDISPNADGIMIWSQPKGSLVKYVYVGGIATDTDDVIANHPSLENACRMQVLALWKRHAIPDRSGMTLGTGDTQWQSEYGMLKDVKMILQQNYLSQVFM